MCGNCFPEGIIVCPACKRDDEGFRLAESESPFRDLGGGKLQCLCGHIFAVENPDEHVLPATSPSSEKS